MAKTESKKIKITLVKSTIAILPQHKKIVEALGLKKIRSFNIVDETPAVLGMVEKVKYLVKVENV